MLPRHPVFLGLLCGLVLITGCYAGYTNPTPTPIALDNVGTTCFYAHSISGLRIEAGAEHPDICMSSSCKVVLEQNHDFIVNQEKRTIQLTWHVIAQEQFIVEGAHIGCSADCARLENWAMETENLTEGEYTVWIGDSAVGTIQVPLQEPSICFDSYKNFQRPSTEYAPSPLATPTP